MNSFPPFATDEMIDAGTTAAALAGVPGCSVRYAQIRAAWDAMVAVHNRSTMINTISNDPTPLDDAATLNGYQKAATETASYPGQGTMIGLMYVIGKLNGEAGEAAEVVFKALRDDDATYPVIAAHRPAGETTMPVVYGFQPFPEHKKHKLLRELGDVLWYVAAAAGEAGYTLSDVAQENIAKLMDRKNRGVLGGSGDDR